MALRLNAPLGASPCIEWAAILALNRRQSECQQVETIPIVLCAYFAVRHNTLEWLHGTTIDAVASYIPHCVRYRTVVGVLGILCIIISNALYFGYVLQCMPKVLQCGPFRNCTALCTQVGMHSICLPECVYVASAVHSVLTAEVAEFRNNGQHHLRIVQSQHSRLQCAI